MRNIQEMSMKITIPWRRRRQQFYAVSDSMLAWMFQVFSGKKKKKRHISGFCWFDTLSEALKQLWSHFRSIGDDGLWASSVHFIVVFLSLCHLADNEKCLTHFCRDLFSMSFLPFLIRTKFVMLWDSRQKSSHMKINGKISQHNSTKSILAQICHM